MGYDRLHVKRAAKEAVRQTRPRPWLVMLVYTLLTTVLSLVLCAVAYVPILTSFPVNRFRPVSPSGVTSSLSLALPLMLFLYVFLILFSAVMQTGQQYYCMKVWRREPSGIRDLFHGFSMVPRVLALFGLILLFTLLWTLLGMVVLVPALWLLFRVTAASYLLTELSGLLVFPLQIVFMAYLYNRVLPYSMAFYLLLDHPEYTARQALAESKIMMKGRRWSYMALILSFAGWFLLIFAIIYVVLLVGIFALMAAVVAAGAGSYDWLASPSGSLLLGLGTLGLILVAFLACIPLLLWLTAYLGTACAGFYDTNLGRPIPLSPQPARPIHYTYQGAPTPPAQPPHPSPELPPQTPPSSSYTGPGGPYYHQAPPDAPAAEDPPAAPPTPPEPDPMEDPWAGVDPRDSE